MCLVTDDGKKKESYLQQLCIFDYVFTIYLWEQYLAASGIEGL